MGDPKKSKKYYTRPQKPYEKARIEKEKAIIKKYGLRRKKELWRAEEILRNIKRRARKLIALKDSEKEKVFVQQIYKWGYLPSKEVTLDDILSLKIDSVLERRLSTQVLRKELANTPTQARQFIVHGHVIVGDHKVTSPKYVVKKGDGSKIRFNPKSKLSKSFKISKKKDEEVQKK